MSKCEAKTRAGTPCRKPAGWGTDHVGQGRCRLHGGASLRGRASPSFKHGLYSKYLTEEETVDFEEFKQRFDPCSLDEEVLMAGFRFSQLCEPQHAECPQCGGEVTVPTDPSLFFKAFDVLTRGKLRHRELAEGVRVAVDLNFGEFEELLRLIAEAIGKVVSDHDERAKLSGEIRRLATGSGGGVRALLPDARSAKT
jgi:hypothetical protein